MKKLQAFTMVEITIAIAVIIMLSYLSLPLIQQQKMMEDTKNIVNEISHIINNDIRDPFYGYIKENQNTLVSTTNAGTCKTDNTPPPCAGNLTYTCISANRVANCSKKSYLIDYIYDSNLNKITPLNGYSPTTLIRLKSIPNSVYLNVQNDTPSTFKLKISMHKDYFNSEEKNRVLKTIKTKLFSDIGVFNSFVETFVGESLCDETYNTCYIEYILR
jgi:competence protein ComGC